MSSVPRLRNICGAMKEKELLLHAMRKTVIKVTLSTEVRQKRAHEVTLFEVQKQTNLFLMIGVRIVFYKNEEEVWNSSNFYI